MKKLFNRFAAALTCKAFQARQEAGEAVAELKRDERGLSGAEFGLLAMVMLILVAVLAVVLIWTFLGDYLQEVFDRITAADTIA